MSDRVSDSWTDGWSLRRSPDSYYLGPRTDNDWTRPPEFGPLADACVIQDEILARGIAEQHEEMFGISLEVVATRLQSGSTVLRGKQ